MKLYIARRIEKFIKKRIISWSYRDLPFDMYWVTEEEGKKIAQEQLSSVPNKSNKTIASFVHKGKWWVVEDNN